MHSAHRATASTELQLGSESDAFSRGGNRLCFVDPRDPRRCIKVLRPDRLPEHKRRQAGFPKQLKPLRSFDENYQEYRIYRRIERAVGEQAYSLVPRLYGWVSTNLGPGLCFDLVRDADGRIAITLKQYLWVNGNDRLLQEPLAAFRRRWQELGMPSRNLLTHNLVLQCDATGPQALWAIDGLGWPDLIPLAYHWPQLARHKAGRKLRGLDRAIEVILARRGKPEEFGYHGWLEDHQRTG